jgi:hypothetical protein
MGKNKPKAANAANKSSGNFTFQAAGIAGALVVVVVAIGASYKFSSADGLKATDSKVVPDATPPRASLGEMLASIRSPCDLTSVNVNTVFEHANARKSNGAIMMALACYRRTLELAPQHPGAYNNLGNALKKVQPDTLRCGDDQCTQRDILDASAESLRTVLQLNPRHANAYVNLAALMRADYRFEEAIALGYQAVSIQPTHVTGLENLGRALQAYSAPEGVPTVEEVRREGWIQTRDGGWRHRQRLEEAVDVYRKVLRNEGPRASADTYRGLGYSYLWLGREAEGREILQRGISGGVWSVPLQYPGQYDSRLAANPVPPPERAACVTRILEAHGAAMVAEARTLLAKSERKRLDAGGAWGAGLFATEREGLHSPAQGFSNFDVLAHCKNTPACANDDAQGAAESGCLAHAFCVMLRKLEETTMATTQLARISRLQAGVVISPHTGLHNSRWRAHIGLKLPGKHAAQLRVGDTIFTWREGEAFVFDDSFEHEVTWNPPVETIDLSAEEARLVLIVDFQHPDVNPVCHS